MSGNGLLLNRMSAQKCIGPENLIEIQFMERMEPLNEIDKVLGCSCIRWCPNEVHQTLETRRTQGKSKV